MKVVLGSASPRRQELLRRLFDDYILCPADIEETLPAEIGAEFAPVYLAAQKAKSLISRFPDALIITADTVVVFDGEIFGKPKDREDAMQMLRRFSGETHKVITGCSLAYRGKETSFSEESYVTFYPLSDEEIAEYLDRNEYSDKAGGYAIQGYGGLFVRQIEGDYYNVVGFPIARLYREIKSIINDRSE